MIANLPVSLIVEITLGVLLAATLFCCMRLETRLRNLRDDQATLSSTVRALNGAIGAAQASLAGLRAAATEADETLGRKVKSARGLADELSLLTSAGERIANRMETAHVTRAESQTRAMPAFSENFRAAR
jgi:conjugal transfer/entry exclusion protein